MKYTPSSSPTGTAGGDLAGTYPDPTIATTSNPEVKNLGVGMAALNTAFDTGNIWISVNGSINSMNGPSNYLWSLGGYNGSPSLYSPNPSYGSDVVLDVLDSNSSHVFQVISPNSTPGNGAIKTTPLPSQAPTTNLTLGTAWQNTNAWDVTLIVMIDPSALTALSLGVGPTNTPTQQTLYSGSSINGGLMPITIKVPAGYYALLSATGGSIVGQMQFNN